MRLRYFFGTYDSTLVGSGQMNLPSKIRKSLDSSELVLTTGFDKCVFGFSPSSWEEMVKSGIDKPVFTSDGRDIRRQFFSGADIIEFDGQGRVTIPQNLRDYAGLNSKIVVIGAGDHFEIWSKEEWDKIKDGILGKPVL